MVTERTYLPTGRFLGFRSINTRLKGETQIKAITVRETAMMMGVPEQAIREGLKRNVLPIGWAEKRSSVWTYHIIEERVKAYVNGEDIKKPSCGNMTARPQSE